MTAFDPQNPPAADSGEQTGTAPDRDPNTPPDGVDPAEWEQFRNYQAQQEASARAEASGSKSPSVEGALSDFDYSAAKDRGGFHLDEWADSGNATIGDVTVSRAALAATNPDDSDAVRAQAAARIDLAVRSHAAWRDSRPVDEQIGMMDTPVITLAPEGEAD